MKKTLTIVLLFTLLLTSANTYAASLVNDDILSDDEILKLSEYYMNNGVKEDFGINDEIDIPSPSDDELISTNSEKATYTDPDIISLYDPTSGNIIAKIIPENQKGFMIIDARKSGYGMLETCPKWDVYLKYKNISNNDKLYYIFPGQILTSSELAQTDNIKPLSNPHSNSNETILNNNYENLRATSMAAHTTYQLWYEDFIHITGTGKDGYGGNQAWFGSVGQKAGCGAVAAANTMAYMATKNSAYSPLYYYSSLSKENFKNYMDAVADEYNLYNGISSVDEFAQGIENFISKRGMLLKANKLVNPTNKDTIVHYFKVGMSDENKPIPFFIRSAPLSWLRDENLKYFNYHWVTVTKYFRDGNTGLEHIRVSSWETKYSINFTALYNEGNIGGLAFLRP